MDINQDYPEPGPSEPVGMDMPTLVDQMREQLRLVSEQVAGLAQQGRVPPQNMNGAFGQGMQGNGERLAYPNFKPPRPSPYSGTNRDHLFIQAWLNRMEQYFTLSGIVPLFQVQVASALLIGRAYQWFRYYLEEWDEEKGPNTPIPWLTFKTSLLEYFGEDNSEWKYRNRWRALSQTGSVAAYNAEFMQLRMVLKVEDSMALDTYIHGLKYRTKWEVVLRRPTTVEEAMQIADTTDILIRNSSAGKNGKTFGTNRSFNKTKATHRTNASSDTSSYDEDSRGTPMELDALESQRENGDQMPFNGKCFNCGIAGHRKADCRRPAKKGYTKPFPKNKKRQ
jgi:Ty3 transposon capsid-like protein/Zinc knuckle